MREVVFILEELSAKVLLQSLLQRMMPETYPIRFIVFEGKQDLKRELERKLKGYKNPQVQFFVLCDKDSADCLLVKKSLETICTQAGKPETIICIACHEIESWYLADLVALGKAYAKRLAQYQLNEKFRNPDKLGNPFQELKRLVPEYQKIEGSRRIGVHMNVDNTRSRSFYHLIKSIRQEWPEPIVNGN